jgi:DNA-directed RNA polymerase subunit RPC12/RpoP
MGFPKRICSICGEEFELRPDKPGFANRCPACSEENQTDEKTNDGSSDRELNAARRKAMRDLLYRKDS